MRLPEGRIWARTRIFVAETRRVFLVGSPPRHQGHQENLFCIRHFPLKIWRDLGEVVVGSYSDFRLGNLGALVVQFRLNRRLLN